MKAYLMNVGEALSQLGHAALFGGNPNITISARSYLNRDKPGWRHAYKWINRLFFLQKDHCRDSWLSDVEFVLRTAEELSQGFDKKSG